jgi:hypothetical protein
MYPEALGDGWRREAIPCTSSESVEEEEVRTEPVKQNRSVGGPLSAFATTAQAIQ